VLSVGRGGRTLGQPTKHVRTHTHKLKPLNHFTVVPQPLFPLQFNNKFRGAWGTAATAAAAHGCRPLPDEAVEDISNDHSSSTVGRRRGLCQERPIGTKAAKAAASTDIAI